LISLIILNFFNYEYIFLLVIGNTIIFVIII